ncbi:MAG: peroxidase-related enzyme [Flammeovirgaceae bacterium]|nr:MAG: peroxidase-related enzyme [Flammeovirgaceae bacterium]
MPYISLEEHLPGVTGLLEFNRQTAEPLRALTQLLLRGPSTLSEAEREWIAALVSHKNKCVYCATSHTAAADAFLGEYETTSKIKQDYRTAPISNKMKALLTIASQVQESGKSVTPEAIEQAKKFGATDIEIHDTVLIAALFCLYNRYVDGLNTIAPTDSHYYAEMAERLKTRGYYRPPQGYDHLKKK